MTVLITIYIVEVIISASVEERSKAKFDFKQNKLDAVFRGVFPP